MKKFLIIILIAITLGGFVPNSIVHAQDSDIAPQSTIRKIVDTALLLNPITGTTMIANLAGEKVANTVKENLVKSAGASITAQVQTIFVSVIQWLGNIILSLVSWILWVGGVIFNLSIIVFVVHMKDVLDRIPAIFTVWKTVRDLANMFFIFILLVIAIQTILGAGNYKKLLTNVVLIALFINFSFFVTGLIIDASNMTALQFYNGFATQDCSSKAATGMIQQADGCMSYRIVESLGLTTIYKASQNDAADKVAAIMSFIPGGAGVGQLSAIAKLVIAVVAGSILMLIISIIFIVSAILLLYRFVELIFLLMFSPFAFACWILPSTKKYFDEWWNKLITQAIFAPVYFMFLWVVMQIITSGILKTILSGNDASFSSLFDGKNLLGMFGMIANYIIVILMMWYALALSKRLGASGSESAMKAANFMKGYVSKHTVGRAAGAIDKAWMKNTGVMGGAGVIGSKLRNITTKNIASKNFGDESFVDYQKGEKERKKENAEQGRKNTVDQTFAAGLPALSIPTATRTPAQQAAVQDLQRFAQNAYAGDLQGRKASDIVAMAQHGLLPAEKLKGLLADTNTSHTPQEKDRFREAFGANLNTALTAHNAAPSRANRVALDNALANLGEGGVSLIDNGMINGGNPNSETLIQMASQKQYEKILENTVVTERQRIEDLRSAPIMDAFGPTPTAAGTTTAGIDRAMEHFNRMTGSEISKLPDTVIHRMFSDPTTITRAVESLSIQKITDMASSISTPSANTVIASISAQAPHSPKAARLDSWFAGPGSGIL